MGTIRTSLTPAQPRQIIDNGLGVAANPRQPDMPHRGGTIPPRQLQQLVAHLKTLK